MYSETFPSACESERTQETYTTKNAKGETRYFLLPADKNDAAVKNSKVFSGIPVSDRP